MLMGRVVGTVVSTQKNETLHGSKLLLVQPLDLAGAAQGGEIVAIDGANAGVGDRVLFTQDGKSAMQVLDRGLSSVDAAILGVIDAVTVGEG